MRTKVVLWTTIAERPHEFSSGECRNQIRNCGYEPGWIEAALETIV
jgi:hypothetical protein